jgi:hypothetical protein
MTTTKMFICKTRSGNFTVSQYERSEWQTIAICNSPKELYLEVGKLPQWSLIIKAEYRKSQLTTFAKNYSKSDAVKAFGLSASKMIIEQNFN